MEENLAVLFRQMLEARLERVHTWLPAKIVAFDHVRLRATVQPTVKKVVGAAGEQVKIPYPLLFEVPVDVIKTEHFLIRPPYNKDDPVTLGFYERSLADIIHDIKQRDPKFSRKHHLTDAIVVQGRMTDWEAEGGKPAPKCWHRELIIQHREFSSALRFLPSGDIILQVAPSKRLFLGPGNMREIDVPPETCDEYRARLKGYLEKIGSSLLDKAGDALGIDRNPGTDAQYRALMHNALGYVPGMALDLVGERLGVARGEGETDSDYRARLNTYIDSLSGDELDEAGKQFYMNRPLESDDSYRARLLNKEESLSCDELDKAGEAAGVPRNKGDIKTDEDYGRIMGEMVAVDGAILGTRHKRWADSHVHICPACGAVTSPPVIPCPPVSENVMIGSKRSSPASQETEETE